MCAHYNARMNWRLLKHKLVNVDYSKLSRESYRKRCYNKLLLNYYWCETRNFNKLVLFSKKISGPSWFAVLRAICPDYIKHHFNDADKDEIWSIANGVTCKRCEKLIMPHREFCSAKCANQSKSEDPNYRTKLSNSLKAYYENVSPDERRARHNKISQSAILFNQQLTDEERAQRHANVVPRLTAFKNLSQRYPDIDFLFDEEYFYSNKYLPVQCKTCQFKWEMTKSTAIARTECTKCNPHKKHKTQTKIFDYINAIVPAKENVKNVISKELDIYVPSKKFAIEYNGLLPHSSGNSKIHYYNRVIDSKYHLNKTIECEAKDIELWHVFENEFLDTQKRKIWHSMFNNKLGVSDRLYARKCVIRDVPVKEARAFINDNHMQGNCNSSVKLGLYHNNELVSIMTFRHHKVYQYEIARFCSKLNTTVVGGASKLLTHFERNYNPTSIISYANRRWSTGNLYTKLGFTFIENTPPNYFYFKVNENVLYPREKFQKHKLEKLLGSFNKSLTERENMLNNDYRVIHDSGNMKFLKLYN